MAVSSIESTPNPSSFLLRISTTLEGFEAGSLKGKTFTATRLAADCPGPVEEVLKVDGIESVYAMASMLTISKHPAARWEAILPAVLEALGGGTDEALSQLLLATLQAPSSSARSAPQTSAAATAGQVRIRMQVSNQVPIQIEATGFLGTTQRAKLPARFAECMAELMAANKGGDFFGGRKWIDRGIRYPDASGGAEAREGEEPEERERREIAEALRTEEEEVEAAYPPSRLQALLNPALSHPDSNAQPQPLPTPQPQGPAAVSVDAGLGVEEVEALCVVAEAGREDAAAAAALQTLAQFVAEGQGVLAARRTAIAFLGGSGGRGGAEVVAAIAKALAQEKSPAMRRTAGDALSDLGDRGAVPAAEAALRDRSSLVRWRAARVLGEQAAAPSAEAELRRAMEVEKAFEVAFELKMHLERKYKKPHSYSSGWCQLS